MIINHNMSAIFASRVANEHTRAVQENIQVLASGERINKASDDASGLAVSEKLRAQIRGLNQASRNVANGLSVIQTTEGYLHETTNVLQRIRELVVQAANGVYSAEDRVYIQVEVSQLVSEINRIASHAQFNGMNLLTGAFARDNSVKQPLIVHMGANTGQRMQLFIGTMTATALKLTGGQGSATPATTGTAASTTPANNTTGAAPSTAPTTSTTPAATPTTAGSSASEGSLNVSSVDAANSSIGLIDKALSHVSKERANLGAYQNRLEEAQRGIDIASENLSAAESRIRDTDMAKQMVEYMKEQILTQAGTVMLAHANNQMLSVMKLFD